MIQLKHQTLYVCEVKFSKDPIKKEIIKEMTDKIQRLKKPKHFSIRPVLIHVNGVMESVLDSEYFSNVIDFGDLLRE
jgi:hypothetical protein